MRWNGEYATVKGIHYRGMIHGYYHTAFPIQKALVGNKEGASAEFRMAKEQFIRAGPPSPPSSP